MRIKLNETAVHEVLERTLQIVGHEIRGKNLTLTKEFRAPRDRILGDSARYPFLYFYFYFYFYFYYCNAADVFETDCSRYSGM
jgi:hypothetical protein